MKPALQVGAVQPVAGLDRCGRAGLFALENLAWPADFDDGAALWPLAIVEADGGAGALQERLGDEKAEPQARGFAVPRLTTRPHRTGGDVGLAQGIHDVRREAGA